MVSSLERAACDCHFRERLELHVLGVRIVSLYGFPRHDLHVFFLVLTVEECYGAKARVSFNELHMCGFGYKSAPHRSLFLVSRDGSMYCCGIAGGDCFDCYIIIHGFFLSQSLSGCVQKCQLVCGVLRQFFKLSLPLREILVQLLLVVVYLKDSDNIGERKSHILQRGDSADCRELILSVITIFGEAVDFGRF